MNRKLISSFGALTIAAAFVVACGEESEVDTGAARAVPAGTVREVGWPWAEAQVATNYLSADAAEHAALPEPVRVHLSADAAEQAALPEPVRVHLSADAAEQAALPEPVRVHLSADAAEHTALSQLAHRRGR
jgi:hypothetical protein